MFQKIFSPKMLSLFFLGVASGAPLLLIGSTLKAWLKESQIDLTIIGAFALVGLPYTVKFLWSPLLDRYTLFGKDRRKSWIVLTQTLLFFLFFAMSFTDPATQIYSVVALCFLIAFVSASQDIALDAYRRELLSEEELALGSSLFVNGYRIGLLLAGAFALWMADTVGWKKTYQIEGAFFLLFILVTILSPKITLKIAPPQTLKEAVIEPLKDYFKRPNAFTILAFLLLYKVGDQMASDMLTPFYLDLGFTKTEIGIYSKTIGLWATIVGGLLGGIIAMKYSLNTLLWVFGIFQAVSTFNFSLLSLLGKSTLGLGFVVLVETLASGMGTSVFIAYMSTLCNVQFSATQYALLSSLTGIPRNLFGSLSGLIAKHLGWFNYFTFCALIAIPGMLLLLRVAPLRNKNIPLKPLK